jgi:hypothetical protein
VLSAGLGFSLAVFACRDKRVDVSEQLGGVPPFGELHGVKLPAPLSEIEKRRPHAVRAAYVGLEERIGDSEVRFVTPDLTVSNQGVPSDVKITAIYVTRRATSDSVGSTQWLELFHAFNRRTGVGATCARSAKLQRARYARWVTPSLRIALSQSYADSAQNGGKWVSLAPEIGIDVNVDVGKEINLSPEIGQPCPD